eukprot:SAG25_NODE_1647_length_2619_cov_3.125000_4_plen_42_part_01
MAQYTRFRKYYKPLIHMPSTTLLLSFAIPTFYTAAGLVARLH